MTSYLGKEVIIIIVNSAPILDTEIYIDTNTSLLLPQLCEISAVIPIFTNELRLIEESHFPNTVHLGEQRAGTEIKDKSPSDS